MNLIKIKMKVDYVWINPDKIIIVEPFGDVVHMLVDDGDKASYVMRTDEWERILPLLSGEPVAPISPTDSLEFSRLMYAWYTAKYRASGPVIPERIQEEKDAYFAIVDYIKRPPPALPANVIDSWIAFDEASSYFERCEEHKQGEALAKFNQTRAMFLTYFGDYIESQS